MGDATSAGSPLVQSSAPRRVPRSHGHFRRWAVAPTRVGRAPRPERADRAPSRPGYTRQFPLADLFRQSIYSRLAGYEDTNDAKRLAEDPTFRMLASRERRETSVALTSTLHWFETEVLAEERNYQGLARLNTELVQREATRTRRVTLDIDSSESPVHGAQEQSAYNGHVWSAPDPQAYCRAMGGHSGARMYPASPWTSVSSGP